MRRICPCISTLFNGGGETIILVLISIPRWPYANHTLNLTVFKHIDCTSNAVEETTEEATPEELGERIVDDTGYVQYILNTVSTIFCTIAILTFNLSINVNI